MHKRPFVSTARRRMAALVASLAAGTAILLVSPAPADAADVDASPAASTAAQTMSVTARPAASEGFTASNLLPNITCTVYVNAPLTFRGIGQFPPTGVRATSEVACTYDINGNGAAVNKISLTSTLNLNGTDMDQSTKVELNAGLAFVGVSSQPCQHGEWNNFTLVSVDFPAGYTPPSASIWHGQGSSIVRCPRDGEPPDCYEACPFAPSGGATQPAIRADSLPEPVGK